MPGESHEFQVRQLGRKNQGREVAQLVQRPCEYAQMAESQGRFRGVFRKRRLGKIRKRSGREAGEQSAGSGVPRSNEDTARVWRMTGPSSSRSASSIAFRQFTFPDNTT